MGVETERGSAVHLALPHLGSLDLSVLTCEMGIMLVISVMGSIKCKINSRYWATMKKMMWDEEKNP